MESVVILANSWKLGGVCLAGKRPDGRWVRPVTGQAAAGWPEASLRRRLGHLPALGERIVLPALHPAPDGYQQENCLVGDGPWQSEGMASTEDMQAMVDERPLWNSSERSASGIADRIGYEVARAAAKSSLRLIHPESLRFIGTAYEGRFKLRAEFTHCGIRHRLCVTDAAAVSRWRDRLICGHTGDADALLCISLGLPLEGYCYKLVAGVIEIHGAQEAS